MRVPLKWTLLKQSCTAHHSGRQHGWGKLWGLCLAGRSRVAMHRTAPSPSPWKSTDLLQPLPSSSSFPTRESISGWKREEAKSPFYHLPLDFCGQARDKKLRINDLSSPLERMWQGGQSTAPVFPKAYIGQWVYVLCTQWFLQNNNFNNCSTLWEKCSVFSLVEDQCVRNWNSSFSTGEAEQLRRKEDKGGGSAKEEGEKRSRCEKVDRGGRRSSERTCSLRCAHWNTLPVLSTLVSGYRFHRLITSLKIHETRSGHFL